MTGAAAAAGVAVKVLVKRDEIAPVAIIVEQPARTEDRAPASFIEQKNARQPPRQFIGDLIRFFSLPEPVGNSI